MRDISKKFCDRNRNPLFEKLTRENFSNVIKFARLEVKDGGQVDQFKKELKEFISLPKISLMKISTTF